MPDNALSVVIRGFPTPRGVRLQSQDGAPRIYSGKEANVVQVTFGGEQLALKWYRRLHGQTLDQKIRYAARVERDERLLYSVGLTEDQVPRASYFIAETPDRGPGLYAVQSWRNGQTLKEVSPVSVLGDRQLRSSLAGLILKCKEVYRRYGVLPDVTGGESVRLFGIRIPDPRKLSPFFATNILVVDSQAVLVDAKSVDTPPSSWLYPLLRLQLEIAVLSARVIRSSNSQGR